MMTPALQEAVVKKILSRMLDENMLWDNFAILPGKKAEYSICSCGANVLLEGGDHDQTHCYVAA